MKSASPAAAARRRRKTGPRRADRRRQIRLDVSEPGPDHAGAAGDGHRRSRPGAGARRLRQGRLARQPHRRHPVCRLGRRTLRRSGGRGRRRGDRRARRWHRPCARRDRRRASISSWSTSRPTCSPGRCWPRRRGPSGVVYSLAYGDQPALTCELVDWARACGFEVVAAGKGTKYLPDYHRVTPDDVWGALRPDPGRGAGGRDEPADVQLVSRRHQVGDRDGGDRERDRARRAGRRARLSALRRRRPAACAARPRRRAARWNATAWSRWSRAWSATDGRCSAICAGACMSC